MKVKRKKTLPKKNNLSYEAQEQFIPIFPLDNKRDRKLVTREKSRV